MKKLLVGFLTILFFIPTCESVWAFSTDHLLLWETELSVTTEFSGETTANSSYQAYLNQSNPVGFYCVTQHGSHLPANDCCYSNTDELNASLPARGDELEDSFSKPFPLGVLIAFGWGAGDIHKASHGRISVANPAFEKQGYANLVGIVKRLD